ncbi:MAG: hypothetical protein AAGF31_07530 [Planctomycetota bacterium]
MKIDDPIIVLIVGYSAIFCFVVSLLAFVTAGAYTRETKRRAVPVAKSVLVSLCVASLAVFVLRTFFDSVRQSDIEIAFWASAMACLVIGKWLGKRAVSKEQPNSEAA